MRRSQVEYEMLGLGSADTDHHRTVLLPFVEAQDLVTVIGDAVQNAGLAGAAETLFARGRNVSTALSNGVQD